MKSNTSISNKAFVLSNVLLWLFAVFAADTNAYVDYNYAGSVHHFIHKKYYPNAETAYAECLAVQPVLNKYNGNSAACIYSYYADGSGGDISSGWLRESVDVFHFLIFFFDTCQSGVVDEETGQCTSPKTSPLMCPKGNPISAVTGNKHQVETDYSGGSRSNLSFTRYYNSQSVYSDSASAYSDDNHLGVHWRHNYSQRLKVEGDPGSRQITASRPNGKKLVFTEQNGLFQPDADVDAVLTPTTLEDGQDGWIYRTENHVSETYNAQGQLLSIQRIDGTKLTFQYDQDADLETLDRISDNSGRTLQLIYDANRHLEKIVTPDNSEIGYHYDNQGRLVTVTQIASGQERNYHYENSTLPYHLTGLTDENGVRYATWSYDDKGRAISSEHAGGIDKTTLDYTYLEDATDPRVTVTNPLGKQTTYHLTTIHGVRKVTQVEGHPTSSCAGANQAYSYDANGNVISKTDWNGVTTTYTYDMDRNLEVSRTEAAGTPEARIITTEWHTDYRLPIRITEPHKITEYSYSPQGQLLNRMERTQ